MTTPVSNVWELQSCVQQVRFLFLLLPHSDDAPSAEQWGELFEGFRAPLGSGSVSVAAPRSKLFVKDGSSAASPHVQPATFMPAKWPVFSTFEKAKNLHEGVSLSSVCCERDLLCEARKALQGGETTVLDLRDWTDTSAVLSCAVLRVSNLVRSIPGGLFGLLLTDDQVHSDRTGTDFDIHGRGSSEQALLVSFPDPATEGLCVAFAHAQRGDKNDDALGPVALDLAEFVKSAPSVLEGFHLPPLNELQLEAVRLARIISRLRAPAGCPWDREQTISSLRPYLIEEAYEAFEAASDWAEGNLPASAAFCEELGDVLLQIVLNAQIASEMGAFGLNDVFRALSEKMVRRHPHVFDPGSSSLASADDVRLAWDRIKAAEQGAYDLGGQNQHRSALATPGKSLLHKALKKKSLPTLEYVTAVSKRATRVGFCWSTLKDTWQDILSEVSELEKEIHAPSVDWAAVEDEMGDVVFALANVLVHAREKMGAPNSLTLDAAVRRATSKFVNRFAEMEAIFKEEERRDLDEQDACQLDLSRWEDLWKKAKKRRYR